MKKTIRFVFIIIAVLAFTVHAAAAHDLANYNTDASTQWSFASEYNYHSGTKIYTYKFKSSDDKSKYETDITNGAKLWGSYINISYSSDSTQGNIYSEEIPNTNVLATVKDKKTSGGHYKSWGIRINSTKYDVA